MGKRSFTVPPASPGEGKEKDKLLSARITDLISAAARYAGGFLGFLDPHGRAVAENLIRRSGGVCSAFFWGGYEEAERVMLGVFPPECEPDLAAFPIAAIEVKWRFEKLTHRDFLGALLSLGIVREKIGDLVVGDGLCTVFAEKTVAPFLVSNLTKVGHAGVQCRIAEETHVEKQESFREVRDTIASARLDCVVAALAGLSRAQAAETIRGGLVAVDFEPCGDIAALVAEGARISVRGCGRFAVDGIGPPTKKGRLGLRARKYM